MARPRIFLLSPATAHGARARGLIAPEPRSPTARQLASAGMRLGDVFTYLSGLYFNGKLTYARRYATPPASLGGEGIYIITMTDGILTPDHRVCVDDLRRYAAAERQTDEGRHAFEVSARALAMTIGPRCDVVFMGSVASGKYTDIIEPAFGERLLFPLELVGRGQLSRGALLFRCVKEDRELEYALMSELVDRGRSALRKQKQGHPKAPRVRRAS